MRTNRLCDRLRALRDRIPDCTLLSQRKKAGDVVIAEDSMEIDVKAPDDFPEILKTTPRAAEKLDFDGLWTSEGKHDPFLPLAGGAATTERLTLGTSASLAFPRSPMVTAYTAWDLQRLSGGRFILGLGAQVRAHVERRFSTTWGAPAPRIKEYVEALRTIWRCWQQGTPLDYQGWYYRFNLMAPQWNPGPIENPEIPIYLAGVGPIMIRTAGEVADGLLIHPVHTKTYIREAVLPALDDGAKRAGRDRREIKLATMAFVITGRNKADMVASRKWTRLAMANYASTPAYRAAVLERHGWGELGRRLSQLAREQQWADMESLIPDEMEKAMAVVGEWDEIGPIVVEKYQGILDRVALYMDFLPGEKDEFWRIFRESLRASLS